jgi:hypothetical protein
MPNPLPYFKLDTTFDRRTEALIKLHGNDILVVLIRVWQQAYYQAHGELDLSAPILVTALALDCQLSEDRVLCLIEILTEAGIYEREAWSSGKLTSNGIRTRTDDALETRRKKAEKQQRYRDGLKQKAVDGNAEVTDPEKKRRVKKRTEEKRREEGPPNEIRLIRKGEEKDAAATISKIADPSFVKQLLKGTRETIIGRALDASEVEAERNRQIQKLKQEGEL